MAKKSKDIPSVDEQLNLLSGISPKHAKLLGGNSLSEDSAINEDKEEDIFLGNDEYLPIPEEIFGEFYKDLSALSEPLTSLFQEYFVDDPEIDFQWDDNEVPFLLYGLKYRPKAQPGKRAEFLWVPAALENELDKIDKKDIYKLFFEDLTEEVRGIVAVSLYDLFDQMFTEEEDLDDEDESIMTVIDDKPIHSADELNTELVNLLLDEITDLYFDTIEDRDADENGMVSTRLDIMDCSFPLLNSDNQSFIRMVAVALATNDDDDILVLAKEWGEKDQQKEQAFLLEDFPLANLLALLETLEYMGKQGTLV
ncbi:MAG: hypothetical protein MJZ16_09345 [Bacteroidales bacterium]|nr:hypothetical protein [Bacteroidales bacterium]